MYRVWYSTETFADYIIESTILSERRVCKAQMCESDASKPKMFHRTPDHIRKILYLDAPDIIVEKNNEPIFSIEISTEAGTGHNSFQRFARIAASAENGVPCIYIYPEGVVVNRQENQSGWDTINPQIFKAMESVMSIYQIPVLLFYYPSYLNSHTNTIQNIPSSSHKGLKQDARIQYSSCPDSTDSNMENMFKVINTIINAAEATSLHSVIKKLEIRQQRQWMQSEYCTKLGNRDERTLSPLSATIEIPTKYLLNYLSQHEENGYTLGELLASRETTLIYQANAKFRGDPYPGSLAAIDYMACREGATFEERGKNLVLLFGFLQIDHENQIIKIIDKNGSTINDFCQEVKKSERHNLLGRDYSSLKGYEIPRYFMQVRYGSTYSKVKHIRVYSYFADAILFPDGALWRDA